MQICRTLVASVLLSFAVLWLAPSSGYAATFELRWLATSGGGSPGVDAITAIVGDTLTLGLYEPRARVPKRALRNPRG